MVMNWLWSMPAEIAAIAVAFIALSLLSISCCVNARHLLRMRFDPEYRRKREGISRHVGDIAEACDQLQVAYRDAVVRNQKEPALRLVEPCVEDGSPIR